MTHEQVDARVSSRAEFRAGWRVLLGATWGIAVGVSSLPFYSAGVLVGPLRQAFGWSLSQIAFVPLASTLAVALCAPMIGAAIDRLGAVRPAAFGLGALALGFLALGAMNGSYGIYLITSLLMTTLALGSSPIGFSRLVNARFDRARGLALGIALSGTGFAAMLAPPAVAAIIAAHGWRAAYLSLAALVLLSLPFVLLLIANGAPPIAPQPPAPPMSGETTAASLARDPRLRRLFVAFLLQAMGVSGFVLHLVPMLQEAGIGTARAALIQGQMGFAIIAGRVLIGLVVDHAFAPRVAAGVLALTIAGLLGFALGGPPLALPMAFALGLALGAEVDLIGYLTARYFGLAAFGRLYGILYGAFVLETGLSPFAIARLHLMGDGYRPALWASAALLLVTLTLLATAPRFPPPAE